MSSPIGIRLLPNVPSINYNIKLKTRCYRVYIIIITFLAYASYHLSRKPLSVVKNSLHRNCSNLPHDHIKSNTSTWCDWAPFDHDDFENLFGDLDLAFLASYAICMFCSGYIAERMNLRYFMGFGMVACGLFTAAFGLGYFLGIHSLAYYIMIQILSGVFQSTGWPSVVTCMGNWQGKNSRGLVMGLWNSHTSVGNILGALIPGIFAEGDWGWSFIVPGIIIGGLGIFVLFFLVPDPKDVNCLTPDNFDKDPDGFSEQAETRSTVSNDNSNNLLSGESLPLLTDIRDSEEKAISICGALQLPGVLEFSLCLFFAKLVSYTFLFWLPKYIGDRYDPTEAANLSTLFDVGGIIGNILKFIEN